MRNTSQCSFSVLESSPSRAGNPRGRNHTPVKVAAVALADSWKAWAGTATGTPRCTKQVGGQFWPKNISCAPGPPRLDFSHGIDRGALPAMDNPEPLTAASAPRSRQGIHRILNISAFGHLRKDGATVRRTLYSTWWRFLLSFLIIGLVSQLVSAVKSLSNGEWVSGIRSAGVAAICLAVLAFLAYRWLGRKADTATSPPPVPSTRLSAMSPTGSRGSDDFKKCPACGKLTRRAKVCRICGHDLAPRYKPSTTPGTSEL